MCTSFEQTFSVRCISLVPESLPIWRMSSLGPELGVRPKRFTQAELSNRPGIVICDTDRCLRTFR